VKRSYKKVGTYDATAATACAVGIGALTGMLLQ
jgi:hypothetical protein